MTPRRKGGSGLKQLILVVMCLSYRPALANERLDPARLSGCYELRVDAWKPTLNLGEDAQFVTPPRRFALELRRVEHPWRDGSLRVRQIPEKSRSIHTFGEWSVVGGNRLDVLWTTGHSGLTMQLESESGVLQGEAKTFWDFHRRSQTAHVLAKAIPCPSS